MQIRSRARVGAAATSVVALAGGLAACGNPVTGPHDWKVTAVLTSRSGVSNNVGFVVHTFRGALIDGRAVPVAGSSFTEQCADYAAGFTEPEVCTVIVNTGMRVYVASGASAAQSLMRGTFKTLDGSGTVSVFPGEPLTDGSVDQVLIEARHAT